MIERYARPDMKQIWSDQGKFDRWLAVEIAACEGWAADGTIPEGDMEKIRQAKFAYVSIFISRNENSL